MVTSVFFASRVEGRFTALQRVINVERKQLKLSPMQPVRKEPPASLVAEMRQKGFNCTEIATLAMVIRRDGMNRIWQALEQDYPKLFRKCRRVLAAN